MVSRARRELCAPSAAPCCRTSSAPRSRERAARGVRGPRPRAHFDVETVNVYNIAVGPRAAAGPPRPADLRAGQRVRRPRPHPHGLPHQPALRRPAFQRFVAHCFGLPAAARAGGPARPGWCLNVVAPGMEHPWHFDTNEFTVSMLTQEAAGRRRLRVLPEHPVRRGRALRRRPRRPGRPRRTAGPPPPPAPGDLQLFKGRYSLHRVSPVRGERRAALRDLRLQRAPRRHRERGPDPAALRPGAARAPGGRGPGRPGRPAAGLAKARPRRRLDRCPLRAPGGAGTVGDGASMDE